MYYAWLRETKKTNAICTWNIVPAYSNRRAKSIHIRGAVSQMCFRIIDLHEFRIVGARKCCRRRRRFISTHLHRNHVTAFANEMGARKRWVPPG